MRTKASSGDASTDETAFSLLLVVVDPLRLERPMDRPTEMAIIERTTTPIAI